jgi:pyruvate/2-oxoglutarate dehydrogenase complex dihydrolipoamide acyltransferase (E2) component
MAARSAPEGNKDTPTRTVNRDNAEQATQARQSGQDAGHSRLAENVPSDQRVPEQGYADYAQNYDEDDAALNGKIPDVFLDSQVVNLNGFNFEVDDLRAKVALFTKVHDLVELSAGIDANLSNTKLTIESGEVQSLLKVRLDNVTAIVDRALTTIDRNPQIVKEIASGVGSGQGAGSAVEDVGGGAQVLSKTTDEAGRTVRRVADGNGSIVEQTLTESGEVSEEAVVGEADTAGEAGEEKGVVQATFAAERRAEDLGVDLSQVEGTGSGGRITIKDVTGAANQG